MTDLERYLACFSGQKTFQTFDDKSKRADLARIIYNPDELPALNKQGAGVYMMVNEGDGKGRKNSNVVRVRAYFADFDGAKLPASWALPPSVLVESSLEHYHSYLLVTGAPADNLHFNRQQEALALAVGAKPNDCKGLARVLRLPGFTHHKGEPQPVKLLFADPSIVYTAEQVAEAYPVPEAQARKDYRAEATPNGEQPSAEKILEVMLRNADLNEGRNNLCFRIACQIRDNGHPQSECERVLLGDYLDAVYSSGDHPFTEAEVRGTIKQAYSEPAREGWSKRTQAANDSGFRSSTVTAEDEAAPPPIESPGVFKANGGYYAQRPVGNKGKTVAEKLTNWTWEPTLELEYPDGSLGERGRLTINGAKSFEINLSAAVWNSRRDVLEATGRYGAVCFTTNSADIAQIRQSIVLDYQNLPTAHGVKSYGLHHWEGEWLEVFEDKTLSSEATPPVFYAGTPVDPGSAAHAAPPDGIPEEVEQVKAQIPYLSRLVTPHTAGAILGYAVASVFAPRITPHLGNRLPFGFIAGEREAGKTSFAQIALEMVTGYGARIGKASSMTPYQYDLAYSNANNSLALLDEYRPGEIDDGQLRKHHDLGVKWRGSGVASKDHAYILNAPLLVLGEGFTDDAAALSRGVLYFVEKKNRGTPELYGNLQRTPWWAYAGHLHRLARETPEAEHVVRLERAQEVAKRVAGSANPRLLYGLTFIAYGLFVLQDDVSKEAFDERTILAVLGWGKHHTLDGGEEGMTNLELFLEQLGSVLAEHHDPSAVITPAAVFGDLILRISPSVEAVRRRYGSRAAISNPRLLRKYAEQAEWCDAAGVHKDLRSIVVRGIKISFQGVPERCDLTALQYLEDKLREKDRRNP